MVPVAADELAQLVVEPLGRVGRGFQQPGCTGLLVDEQPQLVAEVELLGRGRSGDEADHVGPIAFAWTRSRRSRAAVRAGPIPRGVWLPVWVERT